VVEMSFNIHARILFPSQGALSSLQCLQIIAMAKALAIPFRRLFLATAAPTPLIDV
jgi:hypothetical protein